MYPSDRHYTKEHEWISVSGTTARVGITDYAQQQLGDVVFVELPDVGQSLIRARNSGRSSRSRRCRICIVRWRGRWSG